MTSKAVILNLRVAKASDFSNELGGKKYGCMYFQQNFDGSFCNQPYFFHEGTNMEVFRKLYQSRQIWVLAGHFDEVSFIEKTKPLRKYETKKYHQSDKRTRPCTCHKQRIYRK
ncbi:hypothetical protein [Flavobacterium sp.]|uniref:hypothetical protein n=1 Tax=Flavobacterium sp. TaxID=239 RepID=UPI002B9701DF|nr:hypothetical protein [Flavobacterium sp.]HSD07924.1 hypothetical protein [Flavobacterium sp.]